MALASYFLRSNLTILVEKNGNNKRIECLSNDSTVPISVLLCLSITAISLSWYICGAF